MSRPILERRTGSRTRSRSSARWVASVGLAAGLMVGGVCAVAAAGQPEAETHGEASSAWDWSDAAAREFERLALIDLRLQPDPAPDDYRIADLLLERAQGLVPGEARIVRRRAAIAIQSGDESALREATRALVRLDPSDTVAQLRLISMRVGELQTVEDRLAAYERFLGPDGRVFDVSVRSRLALDAALLAREQGQSERFERLLDLAATLDPTNKQAASLAVGYLSATRADASEAIVSRTAALLMADPLDPNVNLALARSLASHGAFEQAARFHGNARRILLAGQGQLDQSIEGERLVLDWLTLGAETAVADLEAALEGRRYEAAQAIAQLQEQGRPTTYATQPGDIRLSAEAERVRVFAGLTLGLSEVVERGMRDFDGSTDARLAVLRDPSQRPSGMTGDQAAFEAASLVAEQMILHIQTGQGAAEAIGAARSIGLFEIAPLRPVLDAWIAFHEERYEEALRRFGELVPEAAGTQIGLARTAERMGRLEEASRAYRRAFEAAPLSAIGAYAKARHEGLTGEPVVDASVTARFDEIARGVPRWVDAASGDPLSFMSFRVEGAQERVGPMRPTTITLSLRNNAPAPLAIGSDRTIPNMFVLSPRIRVGGELIETMAHPEVFEIGNRLRLRAREGVTAEAWADAGFLGWYRQARAQSAAFTAYRVVQAPRMVNGVMSPGALALSAGTSPFICRPLGPLAGGIDGVVGALETGSGEALAEAFGSLRVLGVSGDLVSATPEQWGRLAGGVEARYPSLGEMERAALVLIVPHDRLGPALAPVNAAIDRALIDERSPLVLAAALITRLDAPDDALAQHPVVREDGRLAELADRLLGRLESRGAGYALAGPEIGDLAPFGVGDEPAR